MEPSSSGAGGGSCDERISAPVPPKEEMEEQHKEMATDMFHKITEYLNGELASKFIVIFDKNYNLSLC